MKDKATVAMIAGAVGGVLYQIFVWLLSILGYAKITPFEIGARMMVHSLNDTISLSAQLLGMVQHFANSILVAFLTIYLIQVIGVDHLFLKGITFGSVLYFTIYGVLGRWIIPVSILQPDVATSAVYLFGNLLYSITVFYLVDRLIDTPYHKVRDLK